MSYLINKSDGSILLTLQDGSLDTTTSLGLLGKNYVGYGEVQNENFIFLLENFANQSPPSRPIRGQTWFDTSNSLLNIYNGSLWSPVGAAISSLSEPSGVTGSLWLKNDTNQLYVYVNDILRWQLVGPESVKDFGLTKAQSKILKDDQNNDHPVILLLVNDKVQAIVSSSEFVIGGSNLISGFSNLSPGITMSALSVFTGALIGNSTTSTRLETARTINGVIFDGQNNITITANTTNSLVRGTYLIGQNFNGSSQSTWAVDASSDNIIGKVVARDSAGDFSAGNITATEFIGLHRGNVSVSSGTSNFDRIVCNSVEGAAFTGNAFSASRLSTGRTINGTLFDGTQNIIVTANAETLTGSRLANNVSESSLNVVGILNSLAVQDVGITVGTNDKIRVYVSGGSSFIEDLNGKGLNFTIRDVVRVGNRATLSFLTSAQSLSVGGLNAPSVLPDINNNINLGANNRKFANVYATTFQGVATSAQYADLAENYAADRLYDFGTVLEFGGDNEVTEATDFTDKIAGVVSQNPAYLMNSSSSYKHTVSVALQGRVPCKVKGTVKKGDMMVSAGEGYARAEKNPKIGTVIGKSLENFEGSSGIIEVVVGRL